MSARRAFCALLMAMAGCARAPAIDRGALGADGLAQPRQVGRLEIWEGPESGAVQVEDLQVLLASSAEYESVVAELWWDGARVQLAQRAFDGLAATPVSDGRGNLVFFARRAEKGPNGDHQFRLEHEAFTTNLRARGDWRPLDFIKRHDYHQLPALCGGAGTVTAWIFEKGGGMYPVAALPPAAGAALPFTEKVWLDGCAYGAACSSIVFRDAGAETIETRCGSERRRARLPDDRAHVYPDGSWTSLEETDHRIQLRLATAAHDRMFSFSGHSYAGAIRWGDRRLLVHLASSAADGTTDLRAFVADAGTGKTIELGNLNGVRGGSDRKVMPLLALLPTRGNGRPVFLPVGPSLVLITADGRVWSWDGPAR